MNTRLNLISLLATLCLIGCDRQISSDAYTITRVEFPGATAEEIRGVILSIAPGIQFAVIEDGKASLFHRGSVRETLDELEGSTELRPKDLVVSAPIAKTGKLPDAPKQERRDQIRWEIDRAAGRANGVTVQEIAERLRKLEFEQDEASAAQALRGKFLESAAGTRVPLESLAKPTVIAVTRPIIVTNSKDAADQPPAAP